MPNLNALQKKTAQAIINVFETGRPLGDYGNVTVIPGDPGHLTYGCKQTTIASGNLASLLHRYCNAGGEFAGALGPWLQKFDSKDYSLDSNEEVKHLLRQAGADPIMRQVQDDFFDAAYWNPAMASADAMGMQLALSAAVVFDGFIHGSFKTIRERTDAAVGESCTAANEQQWVAAYVDTRRNWLATHSLTVLHGTVYRMETFQALINARNWTLELPVAAHGVTITEAILNTPYQPRPVSASSFSHKL